MCAASFVISRKTGYKIINRYREQGVGALTNRSRGPVCNANQLPDQIERLIVETKRDKRTGALASCASCGCESWPSMCAFQPGQPFMPCSTATAL